MNRYHTLFGVGTVALFAYAIALQSPGAFAAVLAWLFGTSLGYSMHKIVMLDVMADNAKLKEDVEFYISLYADTMQTRGKQWS